MESRKKTCTGLSGAFQRKDLIKKDKLVSQEPLQIQHIKDQVPVCAFQSPFFSSWIASQVLGKGHILFAPRLLKFKDLKEKFEQLKTF